MDCNSMEWEDGTIEASIDTSDNEMDLFENFVALAKSYAKNELDEEGAKQHEKISAMAKKGADEHYANLSKEIETESGTIAAGKLEVPEHHMQSITIRSWGLEVGLVFFEAVKRHMDFKKKFRVVLEHDPEKSHVKISFVNPN